MEDSREAPGQIVCRTGRDLLIQGQKCQATCSMAKNHIIATASHTCRPKFWWKPDQTLPVASHPFLMYEYFILWQIPRFVIQKKGTAVSIEVTII
ncbi:hypothetical protein BDW62DRAFT_180927 [Aspergillus aurantiobrunneus]